MGSLSVWHWLIVLVIVMLVFGTKRLRHVGSDLGGAIKDFKEGMREPDTGAATAHVLSTESSTTQSIEIDAREVPRHGI